MKTLVCIINQVRAAEYTWDKFKENVIDVLDADLALCISDDSRPRSVGHVITPTNDENNGYFHNAKYIWRYDEPDDWASAFDEMTQKRWREFAHIPGNWLGPVQTPVKHESSGGITTFFRWFLSKKLESISDYDQIIVTRSDYYWIKPHPRLDLEHAWAPKGECHWGICDRHIVVPRKWIDDFLGIGSRLSSEHLVPLSHFWQSQVWASPYMLNNESYLFFMYTYYGLHRKIGFFPFKMFTVSTPGSGVNTTCPRYPSLLIRYPDELAYAEKDDDDTLITWPWKIDHTHVSPCGLFVGKIIPLQKKMKILVTGCAGLIGSNFCRWLGPDVTIIGVDNMSGGVLVPKNVTFVRANLSEPCDQKRVSEHFPVDYVFHFAAYAAEGLSPFIRQYNYTNNTVATAFLISESIKHNVKRFVFTSSMAVYGSQPAPFDESMIPYPADPYGIAKYACEMDLRVAAEQHGLSYCILRPHNVYGPGQNIWDPYRNVLGIWMYQALNKKPMTVYGDGTQKRAFSYIDDILPCIWQAAVNPDAHCEIINVGGIKETELNEAIDILGRITGHTTQVNLEARHEVKNAWSTYQKSVDILGYNETIGLEEGLKRMWDWVLKQPERSQKFWTSYELEKGLYSFWKLKETHDV